LNAKKLFWFFVKNNLESKYEAENAGDSLGWVETGARIKPYWKTESEAAGSIVSVISAADS